MIDGRIRRLHGSEIGYHNHMNVPTLDDHVIFVYASNDEGRIYSPTAKLAAEEYYACAGTSEGRDGMAYAVPTHNVVNGTGGQHLQLNLRTFKQIERSIKRLIQYIKENEDLTFYIPALAAGMDDYPHRKIASLFRGVPRVWLPNIWRRYIEEKTEEIASRSEAIKRIFSHENFYVIEGTDGCGKSTQMEMLKNFFSGNDKVVFYTAQDSTPIGRENRKKMLGGNFSAMKCASLMHETRMDLVNNHIWKDLHRGKIVILDRYVGTTLVYQLQQLKDEKIDQAQFTKNYRDIRTMCDLAMNTLSPRHIFVLDIPGEESFRRVQARRAGIPADQLEIDRFEAEDIEKFQRRAHGFKTMASYEIFRKSHVHIIDALQPREVMFAQIISKIKF